MAKHRQGPSPDKRDGKQVTTGDLINKNRSEDTTKVSAREAKTTEIPVVDPDDDATPPMGNPKA